MLEIRVEVEGLEELRFRLRNFTDTMQRAGDGLEYAVNSVLYPEAYQRSISIWNIRTGHYSSSWYVERISKDTVEIGNNAKYAAPLEFGWTMRNGAFRPSLGVLFPARTESITIMREVLAEWLKSQLRS